jgi:N4-gp56 family major capsid protein
MAKTTFSTSDALTRKLWEAKLFKDTLKETWWSKFMSEGTDTPIYVKSDLTKQKGDKITFGIRMRLTGDPILGNNTLEGFEQKLTTYDSAVTLQRYRFGVRDDGALTRQRAMFEISSESEAALRDQGAQYIDQLMMDTITTSPTKILYGGDATATTDIDTTDKLTPTLIAKVATGAKTGWARSYIPLRPVMIDGRPYFGLVVHPDVMYDLYQDSTFAQAMREAEVRGKENPLFYGAKAIWNGVAIHENETVPITTTWGSGATVHGCKCVFFGAQALTWAWGERPSVVSKQFDYDEEQGYAWRMTAGVAKPVFNSLDYGSCLIYVARSEVSDA